jgi:hypothetical protein
MIHRLGHSARLAFVSVCRRFRDAIAIPEAVASNFAIPPFRLIAIASLYGYTGQ